ncbi:MAG: hypothetical protein IJN05_08640 [Ruminococcus sp.]|nr:hypothetical protein [Ruminococcus sp.]
MYTVSENNIHQILTYSDVYNDKIPDLKNEIALLNIHKSISIISELIRVRNILLNDIPVLGGIFSLPFEVILKKWFGIIPQSSEDLKRNPLFKKMCILFLCKCFYYYLRKSYSMGILIL